jgi:hypothetical protein
MLPDLRESRDFFRLSRLYTHRRKSHGKRSWRRGKEETNVDLSNLNLQAVVIALAAGLSIGGLFGVAVTYLSCRARARIREQLQRPAATNLWRDGWTR